MKTLKILFAIMLATTLSINVSYADPKVNLSSSEYLAIIKPLIVDNLKYPKVSLQEKTEGFVLVEFKVDTNGNIDVLQTNASNKTLENYVISYLESKTISIMPAEDQILQVRFNFKII